MRADRPGMPKIQRNRRMPSLKKYSCVETKRMRRIGVRYFNEKPGSGLQYLHSNGILKQDASSVANWLLHESGVSRWAIGEYLGCPNSFALDVLEHYVSVQKLYKYSFVLAMRNFMSNFRIPGEAQKIERILEVFARHFTTRYPSDDDGEGADVHGVPRTTVTPSNIDTAHILSYSIIMLNTDLHNANVKHHMSREEFVRNNRGIDCGNDLPHELLESIYAEVASDQFKAKEDHVDALVELEKKFRHLDTSHRLVAQHRQLVNKFTCCSVSDWKKSQPSTAHPRIIFLFNDLMLVAKKTWNSEFVVKSFILLKDANVETFKSNLYARGFEVQSRFHQETLLRVTCDCQSTLKAFVRQATEMVSEAIFMERLPANLKAAESKANLAGSSSTSVCDLSSMQSSTTPAVLHSTSEERRLPSRQLSLRVINSRSAADVAAASELDGDRESMARDRRCSLDDSRLALIRESQAGNATLFKRPTEGKIEEAVEKNDNGNNSGISGNAAGSDRQLRCWYPG
eukprot:scpid49648/ scgid25767/ IQ motif and SEC7 domain-containing protein 3